MSIVAFQLLQYRIMIEGKKYMVVLNEQMRKGVLDLGLPLASSEFIMESRRTAKYEVEIVILG